MIAMSVRAQRNDRPPAHDSQWLEFPDPVETSPASVWAADYDGEPPIQSSRGADEQPQQLTADTGDQPGAGEVRPRTRLLDESQVLPNEASFATVKLHQEVGLTPVTKREQLTTTTVEESVVNRSYSRPRTLDVSHVLPGEVSFATVMLNQETARTYSPVRELFAKSGLNWSRLTVEALLLVSVLAVVTMVAFQVAKEGAFSSNRSLSNSADTSRPQAEATVIQPELPTPGLTESAAVSNEPTQQDDQAASTPENAERLEGAVELAPDNSSESLNSEGSRIAASHETRLKRRKNSQPEGKSKTRNSVPVVESNKPGLATQQPRPTANDSEAGNRSTPTERSTVNSPRPQTVEARRESSSVTTNATSVPPKAVTPSAPVTGGGQRPRTVTRKSDP